MSSGVDFDTNGDRNNATPRVVQSGTCYNQRSSNQSFHVLPRDPRELGVTLSYSF